MISETLLESYVQIMERAGNRKCASICDLYVRGYWVSQDAHRGCWHSAFLKSEWEPLNKAYNERDVPPWPKMWGGRGRANYWLTASLLPVRKWFAFWKTACDRQVFWWLLEIHSLNECGKCGNAGMASSFTFIIWFLTNYRRFGKPQLVQQSMFFIVRAIW
jgi:hypothetical protein